MRKALIVCAAAALGLSATAQADPSMVQEQSHLDVVYGDLNLNSQAGAEVLMFRIRSAATKVCGGLPDIRELRERRFFKACFRETVAEAVGDIKSPLLAAVYEEQVESGQI